MMGRAVPTLLALSLLVSLPRGAAGGTIEEFRLPRTLEETLDNGLKVVIAPRPDVGLVDVRIVVKVGSWLEGEHTGSGLSHYAEHLVAGGTTTTRSEADAAERLRAIGGLKNARTEADRTWIYVTTTPGGFGEAVTLIADWVLRPTFPEDEFTRERNVIRGEFDQARDQDARQAWDLVHAAAFSRHPARLPLLGERARFDALTRDDVVEFHRRHWVPGNAILSVVGDVDPRDAYHAVREAFADWPRAALPDVRIPDEPEQSGRRESRRRGVSPRSSVALGWRSVPFSHEDAIPLQVLQSIVADGAQGRLVRTVVDDGLAGGLLVRARTPELGGGLFVVLAHVQPSDVVEFETRVVAEFARLAEDGPTEDEVARARRRMRAGLVFGTRAVEDLAHTLTRDWVSFEDVRFAETYVDRLGEVTVADVRRAAARTFVRDRLSVAVVGAAEAPLGHVDSSVVAGETDGTTTGDVTTLRARTLANGAELRLLARPDAPDVALHVAFAGGALRESPDSIGAGDVLAELLLRSDAASAAVARLEDAGGSASVTSDRFAIELSATAMTEQAADLLDLLAAVLEGVPIDADSFAAAKARASSKRGARLRSPVNDVEGELMARAFGGRLAPPPGGDAAAFEALDVAAVRAFADRVITGRNLVVSIVGRFDEDRIPARLDAVAAALGPGERWRPAVEPPTWPGFASSPVIESTARNQVSVAWAFPGASVLDVDARVTLDLVDAWWSGRRIPSGPLFDALRGDRDLAYFVEAYHQPMPGGGLFWVLVQCAPARYAEVVLALEGAVTELAEGELTEADLASARNVLLASRQSVVQTAAARARLLALAEIYGLPADGGDDYRSRVGRTELEAVRNAVRAGFAASARRLVLWPEGVSRP